MTEKKRSEKMVYIKRIIIISNPLIFDRLAIPIMLRYTLYEFYENLNYITQEKHHACI